MTSTSTDHESIRSLPIRERIALAQAGRLSSRAVAWTWILVLRALDQAKEAERAAYLDRDRFSREASAARRERDEARREVVALRERVRAVVGVGS